MRWIPFLLLAWVFLSLEIGLRGAMPFAEAGTAPSFALILCVYTAFGATPSAARWAALLLGACVDLASPRLLEGGSVLTVLGPNALGFLLAAQFTLVMRGVVFRKNPLALALMAALAAAECAVLVAAFLSLRALYDPMVWAAGRELWHGVLSALYTGLVALPVGVVLLALNPLLGFYSGPARRGIGR